MRLSIFLFFFVFAVLPFSSRGQSGRVAQTADTTSSQELSDRTAKQLFDEANSFAKSKFAEFEQKKVTYSESLRARTEREQKQLAARYAAIVSQRKDLAGEDLYYLGMLHWIAQNLDGTDAALKRYTALTDGDAEKIQTSRSVIVIIAAKRHKFDEAEKMQAVYLRTLPTKASESARMDGELARSYLSTKDFDKAATHASNAYAAMKTLVNDPVTRARSIDELTDDAMLVFNADRSLKNIHAADDVLIDLRTMGARAEAPTLYYYALDNLIKFMIDTGRKQAALDTLALASEQLAKEFPDARMRTELTQRLRKREKQYQLFGEIVPELQSVDQWFPGKPTPFTEMRGKVVFIDFWATWCAPCLDAFPSIKDWVHDFTDDGLVVLGVTRYYGAVNGSTVNNQDELAFFKTFRETHGIPYDFVVTKDTTTQRAFGATTLPTAVLIDRKGVIRFIDSGTSPTRLEELRENIVKLLAEK